MTFAQANDCQKIIQSFINSRTIRSAPVETLKWSELGDGNQGITLIEAKEISDYLFNIISNAKTSIELQSYKMYEKAWVDLLIKKAREGVKIHVQLSDLEKVRFTKERRKEMDDFVLRLKQEGIVIDEFNSQVLARNTNTYSPDMHKKVVVVDKEFAYIGNKNLNSHTNSIEFGIGLKGPAVLDVRSLIYKDLANSTKDAKYLDEIVSIGKHSRVHLLNSYGLKSSLITSVQDAKHSIVLAQVEFDDPDLVKALIAKKKTDPDFEIKIITTKNSKEYAFRDITLKRPFNLKAIEELQENGVEIYTIDSDKMLNNFFHGKISVIDNERIIIGSSDLNERSLEGNAEFDLELSSPMMAEEFSYYLKNIIGNNPADFKFTQTEKLLSVYFDLLNDLLYKLNKIKVKTINKYELSSEYFKIVIRRRLGVIAQQVIAIKGAYQSFKVTDLDKTLQAYEARLISQDNFQNLPVLDDGSAYVFIGTSAFAAEKAKKNLMDPTLNGHFGNGYYFATNIETAIDYSALRNQQTYNKKMPADILVFKVKKMNLTSYVLGDKKDRDTNPLLIEAIEGFGKDYIILRKTSDFELVSHLKIAI